MFTKKVVGELLGGKVLSKEVGISDNTEFQMEASKEENNTSAKEIKKAYTLAKAYLKATQYDFNVDVLKEFIDKIKKNKVAKVIFTETQLEKIYDTGEPLSEADKIKVKSKLLIYDIKKTTGR
jgi:predicted Zn-dependent protease